MAIWADVLKKEQVGVNDNFIALGGHSLLAIRVLGKHEQPVRCAPAAAYAVRRADDRAARGHRGRGAPAPRPSRTRLALARRLSDARTTTPGSGSRRTPRRIHAARDDLERRPAPHGHEREPVAPPMSFAQELLWLLDRATPGMTAYNVPRAVVCAARSTSPRFERALDALVARHEIAAHDVSPRRDGEPRQRRSTSRRR